MNEYARKLTEFAAEHPAGTLPEREVKKDGTIICRKWWYDLGRHLQYEHRLKDGKLNGIQRHWSDNGIYHTEQTFKDGKFDGRCLTFKNGVLHYEEEYEKGWLSRFLEWDLNSGEIIEDTVYER